MDPAGKLVHGAEASGILPASQQPMAPVESVLRYIVVVDNNASAVNSIRYL